MKIFLFIKTLIFLLETQAIAFGNKADFILLNMKWHFHKLMKTSPLALKYTK